MTAGSGLGVINRDKKTGSFQTAYRILTNQSGGGKSAKNGRVSVKKQQYKHRNRTGYPIFETENNPGYTVSRYAGSISSAAAATCHAIDKSVTRTLSVISFSFQL